VEPATLRHLYGEALALVVPTLGFETFGHVLIEAFREGTPVVARRIGPFPELVEQSGGGLLFGSREELAEALGGIAESPDRRAELGRAARAGFVRHWREDVVLDRYLEHVRDGLARRAGRAGAPAPARVGSA
jgi:glycosyltransferase involved in cell wall biosynthesis